MKKVLFLGVILASMTLVACGGGNGGGGSGAKEKGPWTVKFDTNGGAETYEDQIVPNKGLVENPGTPTKSDEKGTYQFMGWRYDGAAWSFSLSKVTKNMTLTARWLEKYSVQYQNADGTSAGEVTYVDSGTALQAPAAPSAPAGQKFYGWMNTQNGGQIWDFENESLNKVMGDTVLKPLFVSNVEAQQFEAELVPDFKLSKWGPKGMPGTTYSGGQNGLGLIGKEELDAQGKNKLGSSGNYTLDDKQYSAFVQFFYVEGDTLTWEIEAPAAVSNATLFMRLSAEYGTPDPVTDEIKNYFTDEEFQITVNESPLRYGTITLHNIVQTLIPFQDYFVSASVSLNAGSNTIQMKVNNSRDVTSAIHAAAPCIDAIKIFTDSTLTFSNETPSNIQKTQPQA